MNFEPIPAINDAAETVGTFRFAVCTEVMSENAKRFRDRARQCRVLAKGAKSLSDREELEEMAAELDAEADLIAAEEGCEGEET